MKRNKNGKYKKKQKELESAEMKQNRNEKNKEYKKKQRELESVKTKTKRNEKMKEHQIRNRLTMNKKQKESRAALLRRKRECLKDNPSLFGIARRFSIDNPYYHDVIEYFEGPLKVWCKGEKLEHDPFWQKVTAGRFSKRLSEAFSADAASKNTRGFLDYVLDPKTQGYQENEWTDFISKIKKIPRENWTDEIYLIITNPIEVAKSKESTDGVLSHKLLELVKNNRKLIGESFQKPVFNKC